MTDFTVEELAAIRAIDEGLLVKIATNDLKLKSVITKYEEIAKARNQIYGVDCETD